MKTVVQSLGQVAMGLRVAFVALCLMALGMICDFVLQFFVNPEEPSSLALLGIPPILFMLGILVDTAGRVFCLAMPQEITGTRYYVYGSVLCNVAAIGSVLALLLTRGPSTPAFLGRLGPILWTVGSVLFLMFLSNLAEYVTKPELAGRALLVLMLFVLLVATLVLTALTAMVPVVLVWILGCGALLVLPIVLMVLYGNLLYNLWDAVAQHAVYLSKQQ
jgi:hypothetical protein